MDNREGLQVRLTKIHADGAIWQNFKDLEFVKK